jgi:hypothetical protein
VKHHGDKQNGAQRPQELTGALEKMRIRVDCRRTTKDEQISERMEDDETNPNQPGDSHDRFLPDHGAIEFP